MKAILVAFTIAAGAALPFTAAAQSVGLGARVGMFGLGGEANVDFNRFFGLRAGLGAIPMKPTGSGQDVSYKIKPPSPLTTIGADLYPLGGHFRLSGGLLFKHDVSMTAQYTGNLTLNGRTYPGSSVGTISGDLTFRSIAPYFTFGFSGRGKGLGMAIDLGAAALGRPTLSLAASGPAYTNNGQFRNDLAAEQQKDQDKLGKALKVLPILSLAFRYGI